MTQVTSAENRVEKRVYPVAVELVVKASAMLSFVDDGYNVVKPLLLKIFAIISRDVEELDYRGGKAATYDNILHNLNCDNKRTKNVVNAEYLTGGKKEWELCPDIRISRKGNDGEYVNSGDRYKIPLLSLDIPFGNEAGETLVNRKDIAVDEPQSTVSHRDAGQKAKASRQPPKPHGASIVDVNFDRLEDEVTSSEESRTIVNQNRASDSGIPTESFATPSTHSADLYIYGQHLDPQTAHSSDIEFEEYPDLPTGLKDGIAKICDEAGVVWADLLRHPTHSHKLTLIGQGVSNIRQKVHMLLSKLQSNFSIRLHNVSSTEGQITQLYERSSTFRAYAKPLKGEIDRRATCELIMKARLHDECIQYDSYIVVVPAHFILSKDEMRRLKSSNGNNSAEIEKIRDEVSAKLRNRRYELAWHSEGNKMVPLSLEKVILSYRQNRQQPDEDREDGDPKLFMNDTVLLGVSHKKSFPNDKTITEADIECTMSHTVDENGRHIQLSGIVPVQYEHELEKMSSKRIAVKVGSATGWMIPVQPLYRRSNGAEENQRPPGLLHVLFVLDRQLTPGDSGTMVYVMHKDNTRYYRHGMLHGYRKGVFTGEGFHAHIATVLHTTVSEMKHEFSSILSNLSLAGYQSGEEMNFSRLLPELKTHADLRRERINGQTSTVEFTPQCEICECDSPEEPNNISITESQLEASGSSTSQTNTSVADCAQGAAVQQTGSTTGRKGADEHSRDSGLGSIATRGGSRDSQLSSESIPPADMSELGANATPFDLGKEVATNPEKSLEIGDTRSPSSATNRGSDAIFPHEANSLYRENKHRFGARRRSTSIQRPARLKALLPNVNDNEEHDEEKHDI